MEFLKRLKEIDPELFDQACEELLEAGFDLSIARARRNLGETIDRYADDLTGQDGEEEIEAAAREYCDAQDEKIRRTDPERWAELRAGA